MIDAQEMLKTSIIKYVFENYSFNDIKILFSNIPKDDKFYVFTQMAQLSMMRDLRKWSELYQFPRLHF